MGLSELEQNLNISPEVVEKEEIIPEVVIPEKEILQKEQVIPQVLIPEQEIAPPEPEEEEKREIITISTPTPGVELKLEKGTEVDFIEEMGTFENFVGLSIKGAELKTEEEKTKGTREVVNNILKDLGKKKKWRGVIVKPENFQNLIYTTETIEIKNEKIIRESIPKRYVSKILKKKKEIKLIFDKKAYNELLKQKKISPLPEGAIEKEVTWNIRYDPLRK